MTEAPGGVELTVLKSAELSMPQGYAFRAPGNRLAQLRAGLTSGAGALRAPCLSYIVRHPSAGVVLIDTGMHPDAAASVRRDFGLAMGVFFRGLEVAPPPFGEQLRAAGVEPHEVQRVVMTHLHVDHTSGMRLLPNATFLCTREEWAAAHRRSAAVNGYVRHHLPAKDRVQLLDFSDGSEPYAGFPRTIDLLGDDTIRLLFTPGHTRGHQSVLLALADGRTVLLVGDAAYTLASITGQRLPMITVDDRASLQSLAQLRDFAQRTPEAILVPSHDPDAYRKI